MQKEENRLIQVEISIEVVSGVMLFLRRASTSTCSPAKRANEYIGGDAIRRKAVEMDRSI